MSLRRRRRKKSAGKSFPGMMVVISAPSGTGKTTICEALIARMPSLTKSVSVTTREPRPGEEDGRDYRFVSDRQFAALRRSGRLLEWAKVHGHVYGTPKAFVVSGVRAGKEVLLALDVHGAVTIKRAFPDALLIMLVPPSRSELARRLWQRQTDDEREIASRLRVAKWELRHYKAYDYVVVNRHLGRALEEVQAIIEAERHRVWRMRRTVEAVLK